MLPTGMAIESRDWSKYAKELGSPAVADLINALTQDACDCNQL